MIELKHQLMLNKDRSWVPCYLKSEADNVIVELKSDIADLRDDKKSTDAILDERNAEIAKLQAVIEERDKEVGKLKRALWLARAENAHNTIYKYHRLAYKEEVDNGIWECYINGEVYRTGKMNRKLAPHVWIELWENIECNCRAMAEKWR